MTNDRLQELIGWSKVANSPNHYGHVAPTMDELRELLEVYAEQPFPCCWTQEYGASFLKYIEFRTGCGGRHRIPTDEGGRPLVFCPYCAGEIQMPPTIMRHDRDIPFDRVDDWWWGPGDGGDDMP